MREALRGTLLSVLFFALLLGGAPTMAGAVYPGGASECESAGGNWVGSGGYQAPNGAWVSTGPYSCDFGNIPMTQEEKCQKAQRDMTYGGGGMAGKTLVKKLPLVGTIGAFLFLQGLYNWGKNDCGGGFG